MLAGTVLAGTTPAGKKYLAENAKKEGVVVLPRCAACLI
jgi:hypothetical protein